MVCTEAMMLVPAFMFQLPLMLKLALEASMILEAMPLLLEVVSVPPLKLKIELVTPFNTTLVASSDWTIMAPPESNVLVAAVAPGPILRVARGELMAPPLVTASVPLLMTVFPL